MRRPGRRFAGGLASAVLVVACSASPERSDTAVAGSSGAAGAASGAAPPCGGPFPSGPDAPLPELRGAAGAGAELWALVFRDLPLAPGVEAKIVWRMTGAGPLRLVAVHPDGSEVGPTSGPTEHLGSNWDRPGDEWGTFFVLPKAGCWAVRASRDATVGEVAIPVGPPG